MTLWSNLYCFQTLNMSSAPLIVSKEEVEELLNPRDLLNRLENAFGRVANGTNSGIQQPVRTVVTIDKYQGFLATMPGYSADDDALATKLVSFYSNNVNVPTHQAWVLLFEPSNGSLLALIDGASITAIRTGIVSAVATKHLANPDSKVLALIGSGVQARSHFEALSLVRHFEEVRVWSPSPQNVQRFVEVMGPKAKAVGSVIKSCSSAREAVEGADVICTVSFATTPVVQKEWVKPGAHINGSSAALSKGGSMYRKYWTSSHSCGNVLLHLSVGACRPDWQELDSELMRSSVIYCDNKEACLKESGDIILSESEIFAEIGEVINGQKEALWQRNTVFKSVGLAIEDVLSAKLVYDAMVKK